jgi:hypothetical protein
MPVASAETIKIGDKVIVPNVGTVEVVKLHFDYKLAEVEVFWKSGAERFCFYKQLFVIKKEGK